MKKYLLTLGLAAFLMTSCCDSNEGKENCEQNCKDNQEQCDAAKEGENKECCKHHEGECKHEEGKKCEGNHEGCQHQHEGCQHHQETTEDAE